MNLHIFFQYESASFLRNDFFPTEEENIKEKFHNLKKMK